MKTVNKWLIGMATVTTILAPLVPKTVNINVNMESSHSSQSSTRMIDTQCDLAYNTVSETGLQVCEYHCRADGHVTVYKTFRKNAATCEATIDQKVAKSR